MFGFIWVNARSSRAIAATPKFDSEKANFRGFRPPSEKIVVKVEIKGGKWKYCCFNSSHRLYFQCTKFEGNLFSVENSLVVSYADSLLRLSYAHLLLELLPVCLAMSSLSIYSCDSVLNFFNWLKLEKTCHVLNKL